ncbi:MAG TPA: GDP-mannose 4,6-dehydratase [Candidatus Binatia bacterium]|jgi:UDP-glucose 4-epimerase|nr:GDP-mannose 4,6-dehydratase [Candidatus Binatia bacterium]
MSTFLITGGAGFIGSHVAETLLKLNQRVVIIDDLSSGSINNIAHLRSDPHLQFVPESLTAQHVLTELVDIADVVIHLAATVGVFNIIDTPSLTIVNNVGGCEAVLKAAAKKKKKVIIASTSEVYGKSCALPFREDGDLVFGPTSKPRWSYAASKVIDEFLALSYWQQFRVPTIVVRLFNTIGPRQIGHYGMVVPRFMNQALLGEDLTVYGNGRQTRCFSYVSDIVEGILLLASNEKAVGEVFNLGNRKEVSINELAQKVIAVTGANVGIKYVPYEKAYKQGFEDMERRVPDLTKVTALTGFSPRVDLDQALCFIRDWFLNEKVRADGKVFHYVNHQTQAEELN